MMKWKLNSSLGQIGIHEKFDPNLKCTDLHRFDVTSLKSFLEFFFDSEARLEQGKNVVFMKRQLTALIGKLSRSGYPSTNVALSANTFFHPTQAHLDVIPHHNQTNKTQLETSYKFVSFVNFVHGFEIQKNQYMGLSSYKMLFLL